MAEPRVIRARWVAVTDPIGRLLIKRAADLWSGSDIPDPESNEYLRGQTELIVDTVRMIPAGQDGIEYDDARQLVAELMRAAGSGRLDEVLAERYPKGVQRG